MLKFDGDADKAEAVAREAAQKHWDEIMSDPGFHEHLQKFDDVTEVGFLNGFILGSAWALDQVRAYRKEITPPKKYDLA